MFVEHRCSEFDMEKQKYPELCGYRIWDNKWEVNFCIQSNFTVFGGSLSESHQKKLLRLWIRLFK